MRVRMGPLISTPGASSALLDSVRNFLAVLSREFKRSTRLGILIGARRQE